MEISVRLKDNGTRLLMAQLKARAAYLQQLIPYMAAQHVYDEIQEKVPSEKGAQAFKKSMRVARVAGMGDGVSAFSIYSEPKESEVSEVKPEDTIFYVQVKKLAVLVPDQVRVLEEFGPWTTTTLPFMPDRKHAVVISRRVPPTVVMQTERDRKADRPFWEIKLQRAGVRHKLEIEKPARGTVVPDTAFMSIRLEFGLGGGMARPHWRPGILGFVSKLPQLFAGPEIQGIMTDPSNMRWKTPPNVSDTIAENRLKDFVGFQNQLGIRIGGG